MNKISETAIASKIICAFKACGRAMRDARRFFACNKTQTVITVLGFFIAAFLVTAAMFCANSEATARSYRQNSLGADTLTLSLNDSTWLSAEKLRSSLSGAEQVIPLQKIDSAEMYGNSKKSCNFSVLVTDSTYFEHAAVEITGGKAFSASDVNSRNFVALISEVAAAELFSGSDPVGQQLKINNQVFSIVGVFSGKLGYEPGGMAIVPNRSARILLGAQDVNSYVYVGIEREEAAAEAVRRTLSDESDTSAADKNKDYGYRLEYNGESGAANTPGVILYLIMLLLSGAAMLMLTLYPSKKCVDLSQRSRRRIFAVYGFICTGLSVGGALAGVISGIIGGVIYCALKSLPVIFSADLVWSSLLTLVISLGFGLVLALVPIIKFSQNTSDRK